MTLSHAAKLRAKNTPITAALKILSLSANHPCRKRMLAQGYFFWITLSGYETIVGEAGIYADFITMRKVAVGWNVKKSA